MDRLYRVGEFNIVEEEILFNALVCVKERMCTDGCDRGLKLLSGAVFTDNFRLSYSLKRLAIDARLGKWAESNLDFIHSWLCC